MTNKRRSGRGIHPLGAYVAKRCPVRLQWDVNNPTEPIDEVVNDLRAQQGNEFEEELTVNALEHQPDGWLRTDRDGRSRADVATDTLAAMADGALVIFDGRLPIDQEGLRVGEPDVLVRQGDEPVDGTWRYLPVDIKHHLTLNEIPDERLPGNPALVSDMEAPFLKDAAPAPGLSLRAIDGDAIQLAHYARILEAHGHMAEEGFGAIIGKERKVVWYDLNKPMFTTRSTSDPKKKTAVRSSFERYDHEFDFRVRVMHTADAATTFGDPDLLVPLQCNECPTCPWTEYCGERLEAGSGHVTLLPHVGYKRWLELSRAEVETRQDLVDKIGFQGATLLGAFTEKSLSNLLELAAEADPDVDIVSLTRSNAHKQHEALATAEVHTAADLLEVFPSKPVLKQSSSWAQTVTRAEAALSDEPFLIWPGATPQAPPRFDVEVDIDMENTIDDRVYLWGAFVHDRNAGDEPKYQAFVDWHIDGNTDEAEQRERAVFEELWKWFGDLRQTTIDEGRTFGAYCWYKGAEETRLTALSTHDEKLSAEVADFCATDEWVDLLDHWSAYYTTGTGDGLKVIAPLAGFKWRADDAGGEYSMTRYNDQLHTQDQELIDEARKWLLHYNEDDCRATHVLRSWMDGLIRSAEESASGQG